MSQKFVETGDADKVAPPWRSVVYTGAAQAADVNLRSPQYASETAKVFKPSSKDATAPAISTKPVSINFKTGQFALTENAKTIIDLQFADVAKTFGNTKIRIEGNTDNVGAKEYESHAFKEKSTIRSRLFKKSIWNGCQ